MRICWFNDNRLGIVKGDRVHDVTKVLEKMPKLAYPYPKGDPLITHLDKLKPDLLAAAEGAATLAVTDVKFLSPVQAPTKIIGTPTNYMDHREEAAQQRDVFSGGVPNRYAGSIEEQGLFLKANSALAPNHASLGWPSRLKNGNSIPRKINSSATGAITMANTPR